MSTSRFPGPPQDANEDEWTDHLVGFATVAGWKVKVGDKDDGRSIGWPRLLMLRQGQLLAVVPRSNKNHQVPKAVQEILDLIDEISAEPKTDRHIGVAGFVWRPADWPEVEKILWPKES